jgi:hypothetical protein
MILVDAHVHIYDCFNLETFFDSAYANFKLTAEQLGHGNDFTGILFLAETSKDNWFQHLSGSADGKKLPDDKTAGTWKFYHTDEFESLCSRSEDKRELFLISGRQIITAENLELLALATINSFQDGTPIKQLIELVREKDGIPVIPWGFGKWMGQRGTVVNHLIHTSGSSTFLIGDSGIRPFVIPCPSQFKLAQNQNIPNLPGSDPLPLQSEVKKPGSSGFSICGELVKSKPSGQLKDLIVSKRVKFNIFRKPIGLYGFIKSQLLLQLKKVR